VPPLFFIMTGFDNYIGIVNTDTASTDLYSRHVGINPSLAESGAQPVVYNNGIAMLRDKLELAIIHVKTEIRKFLLPHFRFDAIIDEQRVGEYDTGYQTFAGGGIKIKKDIESRLSKIYVKQIRLLTNETGIKTVTITDGNETTTYPVTMVAGEEQVLEINYKANREEIHITWNAKGAKGGYECNGVYFTVEGWTGATYTGDHHGMIVYASVICDEEELMAALAKYLGNAILYRYAAEVFAEMQITDRFNYFTLGDLDYEKFEQKYIQKYEDAIKTFIAGLPQMLCSMDSYCVHCNQTRYIETI